jgi:hypothetical protein
MSEVTGNSRLRYAMPSWLTPSVLSRRDVPITSSWQAIRWWESRRIPFNRIVGSAAILSCALLGGIEFANRYLLPGDFLLPGSPGFVFLALILYAAIANLLFTGGWIAEIVVRKLWPQQADRFASLSFSLGLQFAVWLTLAPVALLGAVALLIVALHLLGLSQKPAPPFA